MISVRQERKDDLERELEELEEERSRLTPRTVGPPPDPNSPWAIFGRLAKQTFEAQMTEAFEKGPLWDQLR